MQIEHVHIFFRKLYVGGQEFVSIPVAEITIKGKPLHRTVTLDQNLITQANVREIHIGGNYFAVKTTAAFVVYSAAGKRLDVIPIPNK